MSCLFKCWHLQPGLKTAVSHCSTNGCYMCLSQIFRKSFTRESHKMNETKLFGSFSFFSWSRMFHAPALVCPQWVLSQARYRAEDYITELLKKAAPQAHRHQIYWIQMFDFGLKCRHGFTSYPDGIKWLWHTVAMVSKSFKPQSWIPPRLQISNDDCG